VSSHRQAAPLAAQGRSRWGSFSARYGWRAYALPVLAAITVAALVHQQGTQAEPTAAAPAKHTQVAGSAQLAGFAARGGDEGSPNENTDAAPAAMIVRSDAESAVCAHNDAAQLALVSLSKQHAWMCEKHRQVYSTPVTTGADTDNDQTPVGSWRVQSRERDRYLVGPGYRDYVHYWVPFNGDFGFHDATWQTMAFGSADYTTEGSHGCVHMPMTAIKWLYDWAQVNETVVTIEA
jgi:lipoprotein-anchoring transpeptidase ErfK/SrfK